MILKLAKMTDLEEYKAIKTLYQSRHDTSTVETQNEKLSEQKQCILKPKQLNMVFSYLPPIYFFKLLQLNRKTHKYTNDGVSDSEPVLCTRLTEDLQP